MMKAGAPAIAFSPRRAKAKSWPAGLTLQILFFDALWIAFLACATGAGNHVPRFLGVGDARMIERYGWLLADLVFILVFFFWRDRFLRLARKHLVFVAWPVLAMVSAVWSLAPFISAYHGVQLLMTVMIALMLSLYADLERILQLVFVALLGCAALSLLWFIVVPGFVLEVDGQWKGAFSHKNVLGHMMAILCATSAILLLSGWRPVVSAGGLVVAAGLLALSRSGAAVVAFGLALAPLPVVFLFRRGAILSALATGLVVVVVAIALLASELLQVDLVDMTLDALGKDSTLTGRTILWSFGMEAFQSRPWLGFGFKGYWSSPDTTAYLLRIAVDQELWFFHNNFIEVAVAFGVIGPVLFVTGLLIAVLTAIKKALASDGFLTFWPLFMIVYVIVLALAENPLFENHSFHQLLLVTAVASQLKGSANRV